MKPFYSHILIIEEIFAELDLYELSQEERGELENLIRENVENELIRTTLKHLPDKHHQEFLDKKQLDFLDKEIKERVEVEVKKQGEKLKKEILAEIKRSVKK